jgi:hypothetical protein
MRRTRTNSMRRFRLNKKLIKFINNYHKASFAGIVLGIAILLVPGSVFGQDFQGSDFCKDCHENNYNDWKASGHPYKLMKGEDAQNRPIPLPKGFDWPERGVAPVGNQISYVIGGYKWKSRYMGSDGYIITTTEDDDGNPVDGVNQYNYLVGYWSDYHPGEVKPYNCGSCHTTNWVQDDDAETDDDLTDNQDGLAGIWGKFDAGGVHCEQCHGNGMTMNVDDSAAMCGNCHFRTAPPGAAENVIPASGGWIKHHEQYNEFLASPHSSFKCTTCHDPHKKGEFSIKEGRDCTDCHTDEAESYAMNSMASYGVECKDCHMPYATKNAQPTGPHAADLQTHIFYIDTDSEANMFTDDGAFVKLDEITGKAAVTLDFACQRCHLTGDMTELGNFAKNFHGADTSVSELEYIGLNPGLTGNWWGGPDHDGEGFEIEVSESNDRLTITGAFYTYDTAGNQMWLIAVGPADTGMTSDVTLYIYSGAKWGADFNPADVAEEEFGTGTFTFPACDVGSFTITPNAKYAGLGFTAGGNVLSRDITTSLIACPSMYMD